MDSSSSYQFFSSSTNILCIAGTDGLVKLVNPRFIEVTGWTEEDVLGKSFLDLMHPDDLERTRAAIGRMPDTTTPLHVESKIRCKNNSYRWFSWNTTKKDNLLFCVGTDITQQKHRENEIQGDNKIRIDYQKILESVFDQIVITDPEGVILFVNGAVETITGYSKSEIIGTKAGKLWGGQMNESFYDVLWVTIKENKKTFASKLTNKRKNGEPYVAEIRIIPILTSDNQIQYFVGVERDISIEDELDKLTKITISREVRMSELKEEMRKVMEQNSLPPKATET